MTVLVTGATGNVGRHVVRGLLGQRVPVRAFVRDAARAAAVLGPDVELLVGDLADHASIDRALTGVDRLFLACGNVSDQVEHERRVIDAAVRSGVVRVVKLSGPDARVDSPLIFERWHGLIEEHLAASGLPRVLLRPRTYMTNLLAYAPTVAATGMLFAPAGEARISFIDPRDVAEVAVTALTEPGHEGRTYTLTGPEAVTFAGIADALSAATGRTVTFVDVPDDAARQAMIDAGLPPTTSEAIVAIFASQRAGSMTDTTDTLRSVTGHEPRSVADFARDYAALFTDATAPRVAGVA